MIIQETLSLNQLLLLLQLVDLKLKQVMLKLYLELDNQIHQVLKIKMVINIFNLLCQAKLSKSIFL